MLSFLDDEKYNVHVGVGCDYCGVRQKYLMNSKFVILGQKLLFTGKIPPAITSFWSSDWLASYIPI
jgi:hypothetical protein